MSSDETLRANFADGYVPRPGDRLRVEHHEQPDGGNLLILSGELDIGSAQTLTAVLQSVESGQPPSIVLDLSELQFVDSTGITALVHAELRARGEHRRFMLRNLHRNVRRLFDLTGLDSEFTIV